MRSTPEALSFLFTLFVYLLLFLFVVFLFFGGLLLFDLLLACCFFVWLVISLFYIGFMTKRLGRYPVKRSSENVCLPGQILLTEAGAHGQAMLPVGSPVAAGLRHGHEVAPDLDPAAVDDPAVAIPTKAGDAIPIHAAVSGGQSPRAAIHVLGVCVWVGWGGGGTGDTETQIEHY